VLFDFIDLLITPTSLFEIASAANAAGIKCSKTQPESAIIRSKPIDDLSKAITGLRKAQPRRYKSYKLTTRSNSSEEYQRSLFAMETLSWARSQD
jgi:predicted GTPase